MSSRSSSTRERSMMRSMLVVLTNRLGRIIDRSRVLEDRLDIGYNDLYMLELDTLYKRTHLINYSISLSTACGFFVCIIIAMLFLGDILNLTLDKYIAVFFVLAVLCLIGCFTYLLREIYLSATAQIFRRHVRPPGARQGTPALPPDKTTPKIKD